MSTNKTKSTQGNGVALVGAIPIRPTMLRYLCFKEGILPTDTIDLRGSGHIKSYLKDLLCAKRDIQQSRINSREFSETYSAYFKFMVSARMEQFYTFFVSRDGIVVFDRFLYSLMINDLNVAITMGVRRGQTEKEVIQEFLAELGLEEAIEHDSLKRACTRYRARQGQKNLHEIKKKSPKKR